MKLLVVASTFPAGDNDPVPAFVKEQLVAFKRMRPNTQISVLAPHDARSGTVSFKSTPEYDEYRFHYFWPFAAERLAGRGILPALRANPLQYLLIPFLFLGEFLALLSLTKRLKPEVIYAHWFTPQGVVASWVSRLTRTPFAFTTHASDVDVWRKIPVIGAYIVRTSTNRAVAFTAVSRRTMAKLQGFFSVEEWRALEERGAIIPMGVALPNTPARPERSDRTMILFLGRLVDKKGVHYLLRAYAAAHAEIGRSLLVIAGEGPMLEQLERQAVELGIASDVQFAGFVSGAKKVALLQQADIYVVPSIVSASGDAEGLPVSLMEGLAYGKVCVATVDSGANEVLTQGKDGFLIPGQDVGALSVALVRAANLEPQERRAIESAAKETARQFDWGAVAERHHDFLFARFDGNGR